MLGHEEQQAALDHSAIAIIGMSCRFPGATSIHQYWQNLLAGVESIQVESDLDGRVRARAEIAGIEDFDYGFFGFSFKEAQLLDPQHRLLLECAWEVLEEAALHLRTGSTGVFCGAGPSSYFINNVHAQQASDSACGLYQSSETLAQFMATDKEFLASRIAYKLNCCGPAVNVQAACATSIFSIQVAIQALLLGECDTALVGAAAVSVPQSIPYYFEPGMPFSADGHCRPFDAKASGTVFGSGAAVVALKRLGEALADGDPIHAVVRSVATNNDGAHRAGMSAPSVAGQARVIREAFEIAGVEPRQISYVEAHGTATPIGDPIEVKALANVFAGRERADTCYLGSVKGNIGHLGWAAGMAGLIKAVLIAKHRIIPPTLNFEAYNPQLHIEETPFIINRQLVTLSTPQVLVGVSSFGIGGNNSHLIIETSPNLSAAAPVCDPAASWLIPVSAKDRGALQQLCAHYRRFLEDQADESFSTFVANLWSRRSQFEQRAFVIASHRQEAIQALAGLSFDNQMATGGMPRIGLMFSGQGGEQRNMGQALYKREALFKAELDRFDPVCLEVFGASAASLLFDPLLSQAIEQNIARSQPMTFVLQVAMARLLLGHGSVPIAVFGHSLGEYAAACIAGVFNPEQGFRMLVERSRLLESLGDVGAMLVLAGDRQCALRLIKAVGSDVSIAALNTSNNTVVSGGLEAVEQLRQCAAAAGVNTTRLNISRPGHSSLLDPLLDRFEAFLAGTKLSPPSIPMISTVTGKLAGAEVASAQYWRRQLRETVDFRAALGTALDLGCSHLVEIGAKATLTGLVLEDAPSELAVLPMARGDEKDHQQYLKLLGALFSAGADLQSPLMMPCPAVLDGLPTYPFQRLRCWIEASHASQLQSGCSYWMQWQGLTLEGLDSSSDATSKVLFLTPEQSYNRAEIYDLQLAFEQFHRVALERFMDLDVVPGAGSGQAEQLGFANLWREYPDGIDRVYLDLRHLPGSDLSVTVSACTRLLDLLRSIVVGSDQQPQLCLLFASEAAEYAGMDLHPLANSVAGMLRSVLVEEPGWKVNILHFIREPGPSEYNEAGPIQLLTLTDELVVSIRQSQAFVPRLERLETRGGAECAFASELSYLLIGGAGGIGTQLIERLCADHVRGIHVIGRSADPGEGLRKLMARNLNIHYLSLDLASEQGRDRCSHWLQRAALGKVAVFNLAVDLDDKLYGEVRGADLARAFNGKCASVLSLYQLLCKQGLVIELLINFSTATSILGNGGQSAYGAASAFLDAAQNRLFPGAKLVLTINWGVWSDAGKLSNDLQRLHVLKANGLCGHSSEQGLLFMRQLLAGPCRLAAFMNIQAEVLSSRSWACAQFLDRLTAAPGSSPNLRPASVCEQLLACTDDSQCGLVLERWLVSTVDDLVGLEVSAGEHYEVIKNLGVKALGFDSLALVQFKNALASQLGLQWSVKRLHGMQALRELHVDLMSLVLTPEWRVAQIEPQATADRPVQGDALSLQQARWCSLIGKGYGLRIIPYLIHCPFDAGHCRAALAQVLDEHKLLRTYFPGGRPCVSTTEQVLEGFGTLFTDLSSLTESDKNQQITACMQNMAQALPKPEDNVTWAIHFIDVGEPFFIALLGVQHLEFDGKSLTLLFDRLAQCLHQLARQQPLTSVAHPLDYSDYVQCQQQYRQQWSTDAGFFRGLYNAFDGPTVLPGHPGFASTVVSPSSRHSVDVVGANRDLVQLAGRFGFSVFNAVLYVYATTMAEVIGCDQLVISAINSGRGLSEFNDVIGPFTSPLPVPITVHHDWLNGIAMVARTLDAMQDYPLMHPCMLIDAVPVFSGMAQDSYFSDLGINFLNYRHTAPAEGKVRIEGVEILGPVSSGLLSGANVEDMRRIPGLHLVVEINGDDLRFNYWFHSQRFSLEQVQDWGQLMTQHLQQLLKLARAADEL